MAPYISPFRGCQQGPNPWRQAAATDVCSNGGGTGGGGVPMLPFPKL